MSKPIYGESAEKIDCLPDSTQVTGLVAQANFLLESLTGTNKATTLAQLDNVRHQLMYIAGIGTQFQPYQIGSGARSRGTAKDVALKGGMLEVMSANDRAARAASEVVRADRPKDGAVQ